MLKVEEIKRKITELAKAHHETDLPVVEEIKSAEMLEEEAEELIVAYCEQQGYLIDGLPAETAKLMEAEEEDDLEEEDEFSSESVQLYLDTLSTQKEDVAELWWHYHHCFWPDWAQEKEAFLSEIKENLGKGY